MDFTKDNFDTEVIQSSTPVFVDFWAPWCGPCKTMSPIIDEVATELSGVKIGKVNVDDNQEIAQKFNILSIPTFIMFKNGQVVDQFSGSMGKEALKDRIGKHLA